MTPKAGDPDLVQCSITYVLSGSTVVGAGLYDMTRSTNALAVVGGTGRYSGAAGELKFRTKSDSVCDLTIRLRR